MLLVKLYIFILGNSGRYAIIAYLTGKRYTNKSLSIYVIYLKIVVTLNEFMWPFIRNNCFIIPMPKDKYTPIYK